MFAPIDRIVAVDQHGHEEAPLLHILRSLPTMLEEQLSLWLERLTWYESPLVRLPIDVASTILVGGLVGVLEVTLAHALIAVHRRRREAAA